MATGEVILSSKPYTEEFKIEAVRQVVDRGYSVAEVADAAQSAFGRLQLVALLKSTLGV